MALSSPLWLHCGHKELLSAVSGLSLCSPGCFLDQRIREDLLREETAAPAWRLCLCSAVPSLLLKELDVEVLGFSSSPGRQVLLCLLFHASVSISLGYFTLRAGVAALAVIQYTDKNHA